MGKDDVKLSFFADDMKLCIKVSPPTGRGVLHRVLEKPLCEAVKVKCDYNGDSKMLEMPELWDTH